MSGYNSQRFSREFSHRTEENMDYILRTVNRDEKEQAYQTEFLNKYQGILDEINSMVDLTRQEAAGLPAVQKGNKENVRRRLYSLANKLDENKRQLESNLRELVSTRHMQNDELFEVTQLLNSLMGIAVLPYEMHKEYFKRVSEEDRSEYNRGRSLRDIQSDVKNCPEYQSLFIFIMQLYDNKKWVTSYHDDLNNGAGINENVIVFRFLKHLRNVTCHSGDNAISILPLNDGQEIKEILFYDVLSRDEDKEEFAMRLTVKETERLIKKVARFYQNSKIGEIDKTANIAAAEKRVNALLNKNL